MTLIKAGVILVLLFSGIAFNAAAQNSKIDSLKQIVRSGKADTVICMAYASLCRSLERSQADSALYYGQEGLKLSKQLHYLRGELQNTIYIGRIYNNLSDFKQALQLLIDSKDRAEKNGYYSLVAACLNNIGRVYSSQGDTASDIRCFRQSNELARKIGDEFWQGVTYLNIGECHLSNGMLDSARYYLNLSYDYGKLKLKINEMTGFSLSNLGTVYQQMNEPVLALQYLRSSVEYLEKDFVYDGISIAFMSMSEIFKQGGKKDSAFHYAKLAYDFAYQGRFPLSIISSLDNLIPYYVADKRYDSAFYYQSISSRAKDSLFSSSKRQELQQMMFEQWREKDLQAAEKEKREQEEKENLQYWIIAIFLLSFIGIFSLLSGSIIVNEKWIGFFGILGLLLLFEFLNLLIHPFLAKLTGHSPLLMLVALACVASMLIPLHHRIEHWVKFRLVEKNRQVRLKKAKKIVEELERPQQES